MVKLEIERSNNKKKIEVKMSEHCINQTRKKTKQILLNEAKQIIKDKNIQMNTLKQRSALNKKKILVKRAIIHTTQNTKQANREQEIHLHTCSS